MIIDGTLRPQRTHTYGVVERPPSPLDFVHLACLLRDEPEHEQAHQRLTRGSFAARDRLTA